MKKQGKLRNKLISLFILVAVVCSLASFLQTSQSLFNTKTYEQILEQYGFSQGDIASALLTLTDAHNELREMVNARTDEDFSQREEKLNASRAEYASYLELIHHSVNFRIENG